MAKKDDDDETPKKKGKSKLVPVLVLAALGGGYFMFGRGGGAEADAAEAEPEAGALVSMESISVNLLDGYLSIGVGLELSAGVDAEHFEEAGELAKMQDLIISSVAGHTMAELQDPAAQEHLKEDLLHGAQEIYEEDTVLEIYLTEFVMQ